MAGEEIMFNNRYLGRSMTINTLCENNTLLTFILPDLSTGVLSDHTHINYLVTFWVLKFSKQHFTNLFIGMSPSYARYIVLVGNKYFQFKFQLNLNFIQLRSKKTTN